MSKDAALLGAGPMEGNMETNLCANCFAALTVSGGPCPVCGWDNSTPQPPEALGCHTVVASRYQVGRVKAQNGEGITYAALDLTTQKLVELREFFPTALAQRAEDGTVYNAAVACGPDGVLGRYRKMHLPADEPTWAGRGDEPFMFGTPWGPVGVSICYDTFYAVYEYVPSVTLGRYLENSGGSLPWNTANRMFQPILSALGLINSLGVSHLGISPDTLRVTKDSTLLITGFSIVAARREGTGLEPELAPGFAALEQYSTKAPCGEASDVYGFAATLLYAITGQAPLEATRRMKDQRLMISKEVLHSLPPFAVTAIANALQVRPDKRTASFERFKTELSAAPTLVNEVDQTEAIRRIPPLDLKMPQSRGLPPFVWLIGSGIVTFVALVIVASLWLGERGMSFNDLTQLIPQSGSSQAAETVPNLVNENYQEILQQVEDGTYPFTIEVSAQEFNETVPEGCISSQVPFGGEPLPEDGVITVTVSRGSSKRSLPEFDGVSYEKLQEVLTASGFVPQRVDEASEDVEAGYVLRYQDHQAGDSLDYGATVTVVVSSGPAAAGG